MVSGMKQPNQKVTMPAITRSWEIVQRNLAVAADGKEGQTLGEVSLLFSILVRRKA